MKHATYEGHRISAARGAASLLYSAGRRWHLIRSNLIVACGRHRPSGRPVECR